MDLEVKYDRIGRHYNRTRCADPGITALLYAQLKTHLDGSYLEIGCGSGNYANALHRLGMKMIGVDPSVRMLTLAKRTSHSIQWLKGRADAIPLDDKSVVGAVAMLTIHHWPQLGPAMREMRRVVQPKGKFVLFTSFPEQMQGYWLNHYFPQMMLDSMDQMPDQFALYNALENEGWQIKKHQPYFIQSGHRDMFLYCGKHQPERYFDKHIRQGISSFSDLAYKNEVDIGLKKLQTDIKSGAIIDIKRKFENSNGDYCVITAE